MNEFGTDRGLLRELRINRLEWLALGLPDDLVLEADGLLNATTKQLETISEYLIEHEESGLFEFVGELISVKRVPADTGVSYGHLFTTSKETNLGLVALGFSDGIPRSATNKLSVQIGDRIYPAIGRIAMDQLIVDLQDADLRPGSEVVIFNSARSLSVLASISSFSEIEILGRIAKRVSRRWA